MKKAGCMSMLGIIIILCSCVSIEYSEPGAGTQSDYNNYESLEFPVTLLNYKNKIVKEKSVAKIAFRGKKGLNITIFYKNKAQPNLLINDDYYRIEEDDGTYSLLVTFPEKGAYILEIYGSFPGDEYILQINWFS